MKLYVVWTNRERPYHYDVAGCRVLVSPNNVTKTWRGSLWTTWPNELLVDSGAFQRDSAMSSPEETVERQWQIVAEAPVTCEVLLSHADVRLDLRGYSPVAWKLGFEQSLERAGVLARAKRDGRVGRATVMGVIQAFDETSVARAAARLRDMGYSHFGIGSLVSIVHSNMDLLLRLIDAAMEGGARPLHVFGISAPSAIVALKEAGVDSIDSSTPIREAINGSIDYGRPFRRFQIPGSRARAESLVNYGFRTSFSGFLACECPVCRVGPEAMLEEGRTGKAARALHNYWQLRADVEEN